MLLRIHLIWLFYCFASTSKDDRDNFLSLTLEGYKRCLVLGDKYDVRVVRISYSSPPSNKNEYMLLTNSDDQCLWKAMKVHEKYWYWIVMLKQFALFTVCPIFSCVI